MNLQSELLPVHGLSCGPTTWVWRRTNREPEDGRDRAVSMFLAVYRLEHGPTLETRELSEVSRRLGDRSWAPRSAPQRGPCQPQAGNLFFNASLG